MQHLTHLIQNKLSGLKALRLEEESWTEVKLLQLKEACHKKINLFATKTRRKKHKQVQMTHPFPAHKQTLVYENKTFMFLIQRFVIFSIF